MYKNIMSMMERGGLPEYYEMFVQVYYEMERGSLKGKGEHGILCHQVIQFNLEQCYFPNPRQIS